MGLLLARKGRLTILSPVSGRVLVGVDGRSATFDQDPSSRILSNHHLVVFPINLELRDWYIVENVFFRLQGPVRLLLGCDANGCMCRYPARGVRWKREELRRPV